MSLSKVDSSGRLALDWKEGVIVIFENITIFDHLIFSTRAGSAGHEHLLDPNTAYKVLL